MNSSWKKIKLRIRGIKIKRGREKRGKKMHKKGFPYLFFILPMVLY